MVTLRSRSRREVDGVRVGGMGRRRHVQDVLRRKDRLGPTTADLGAWSEELAAPTGRSIIRSFRIWARRMGHQGGEEGMIADRMPTSTTQRATVSMSMIRERDDHPSGG
jgi:hypothetical protein